MPQLRVRPARRLEPHTERMVPHLHWHVQCGRCVPRGFLRHRFSVALVLARFRTVHLPKRRPVRFSTSALLMRCRDTLLTFRRWSFALTEARTLRLHGLRAALAALAALGFCCHTNTRGGRGSNPCLMSCLRVKSFRDNPARRAQVALSFAFHSGLFARLRAARRSL